MLRNKILEGIRLHLPPSQLTWELKVMFMDAWLEMNIPKSRFVKDTEARKAEQWANKMIIKLEEEFKKYNKDKPKVTIYDLKDIIHFTIIDNLGKNEIALKPIQEIDGLIHCGKLYNYSVENNSHWQEAITNKLILK